MTAESILTVLLVEDNDADARLLREYLDDEPSVNVKLMRAKSVAEAAEYLSCVTPDVALVDLGLPDAQGLDTVRHVHAASPGLAVIVLTGRDDRDLAVQSLQQGAQDYLVKGRIDGNLLSRAIRYAIERQKMRVALEGLALIDDMTGLYNRRGFVALAEHQLKVARRTNRPFALVYTDIDRLKIVNDTLGHGVGDQAIVDTAMFLRQSFRSSDVLGRLGGDEFGAFMLDAGRDVTTIIHGRLVERLRDRNTQPGQPFELAISLGVLCCEPDEPRSLEQLLSAADSLMYLQKKRDRASAGHA